MNASRPFLILFFLFHANFLRSQDKSPDTPRISVSISEPNDSGKVFTKVEMESYFPGGVSAWYSYLNSNLKYPSKAFRTRIQGTVILRFIIEMDGNISNITVVSGDAMLADAAIAVIRESPPWHAAIQNGKLVRSLKQQSITFSITKKAMKLF
jgi:periplasmic protein TonB